MSRKDEFFMQRALELAKKGIYKVAPNPMVGAVIVHEGKIIGEGYHQQFGNAHAEVNAIRSVEQQELLEQATLYVNLEPCSHHGKTPPCADLLIKMKLKEVVIANLDPSEKVAGRGVKKLQQAGIKVVSGVLKKEGEELNKRFFRLHADQRPYITLKWAITQDGFIGRSLNDPERKDSWITNELSKQLVHQWRAEEMGILVGKNTVLIDEPELTCREFEGKNPIRIVIDPKLEIPTSAKIFNQEAPTLILNEHKEEVNSHLNYLKYDKETGVLDRLFNYCREKEIHSILVEGGSYTLSKFIESGNWDEAKVFQSPKNFISGIAGPKFNAPILDIETIREDKLYFYKNPRP